VTVKLTGIDERQDSYATPAFAGDTLAPPGRPLQASARKALVSSRPDPSRRTIPPVCVTDCARLARKRPEGFSLS